jgi:hypothetical protein
MTDTQKDLKWIKKQLSDLAWNEKQTKRKTKTKNNDISFSEEYDEDLEEIYNKIIEEEKAIEEEKKLKKIERQERASKRPKIVEKKRPTYPTIPKISSPRDKKITQIEEIIKEPEFHVPVMRKTEIIILAPMLVDIIRKDIESYEKINFKFNSLKATEEYDVCYKCGNDCEEDGFKSVMETKDGIKKVKFCSIDCFEDTNKKHWFKLK